MFFPDYEPQTICEHLQYLFALLQNSKRRYIDPSGFVKALGLDTGQQQVCGGASWHFQKLGITLGWSGSYQLGLASGCKHEGGGGGPGPSQSAGRKQEGTRTSGVQRYQEEPREG